MIRIILVLILIIVSFISLFIGVKDISILDLHRLDNDELLVMVVSRLPRMISVLIAGIGMSISGLIVQQISLNKFVSPTTMGTLDACKMGILFSMILFPSGGMMYKMVLSFTIALLASVIFLKISSKIKMRSIIFIPLVGIVFGNILNAISTFFAYKYNLVQNMEGWLIGDFSSIIQGNYEVLYLGIPVVILSYLYANKFTIVGLGEETATSLGLDHKKITYLGLTFVAITSTVVVLTAGVIPFLGLIIPNIVSLMFGDNLKKTISYTALIGAIFLLICDIISRMLIAPYEIPIGLTVSIIGGVIFLVLILKRAKNV
ncbi:iron chelate uptake ABC transporter family permease subunit [Myroides sp. BIT-d1]|uniref:Iron chelate uptake ABC transporter family permease subunit n=1 Tax=Myroides albus TaxID=2562892 RepID=A0A6I3LIC3_9FLAO|nr:iron chelate uptake ABC transporter family permease subunit [Myroides albus]MTG97587.1 iron chelate uptake ABC transporter family permease subunit [Myroides albus]